MAEKHTDENLYRVVRKDGSHLNTKVNPDGTKSALQFTDDNNDLNGPVDLLEVDEEELIRTEYISVPQSERSLGERLIDEVVVPVIRDATTQLLEYGTEKAEIWIEEKVVPVAKSKVKAGWENLKLFIFAIKDFQKKNGLVVDGIAGTQTMNKLKNSSSSSNILSWNDIKNFKKSEFDCPCCGKNNIDLRLVKILEDYFRNYYNAPTIITSGCRCQKYNNSLTGSVKGSRHIDGAAADFYVKGISVNEFYARAKELQAKGIIKYTYTNNSNMRGAIHINI